LLTFTLISDGKERISFVASPLYLHYANYIKFLQLLAALAAAAAATFDGENAYRAAAAVIL
jgi:hypothetical protein